LNTASTTPFFVRHGSDEQILADLNFHRAKPWCDSFAQSFPINDMSAFDRDGFIFGNVHRRKQTAPMDLTRANLSFRRAIRKWHHNLGTD